MLILLLPSSMLAVTQKRQITNLNLSVPKIGSLTMMAISVNFLFELYLEN